MDQATIFIQSLTELIKILGTTKSIIVIFVCFLIYAYSNNQKKIKLTSIFLKNLKKYMKKI